VVYGVRPVLEALSSSLVEVAEVAVGPRAKRGPILDAAQKRGVPCRSASPQELSGLARTRDHQNAVAILKSLGYLRLAEFLETFAREPGPAVALDSITDPQNLGAIARSAHFFGCQGIITTKDRAAPVTPAGIKASAGALLHIPVVREPNLVRALKSMKEAGYWIVGSSAREGEPPWDLNLTGRIVLVVGSEDKGLSRLTKESCDLMARIPRHGLVSSLNAAQAAGAILYEAARQRGAGEPRQ
jgi:23S rRNA (guanosine2251-2'-O)-methyltransferase